MSTTVSLFGQEALRALQLIRDGARVESIETETLDCKEDPSRRDDHGRATEGDEKSDPAARIVAAAASCLANQHGGCVLVGLDDKKRGEAAAAGTRLSSRWLRERLRELTVPPLSVVVAEDEVAGERVLIIEVPRNESTEPFAAIVSKNGGQRRARRVGRQCQEMKTVAEMLEWSRDRSGYDWSAQPSGRPVSDARPAAIAALTDFLRESGEPDRAALADLPDRDLLARLQLLAPDGRLTRAGEVLLCPTDTPRLRYSLRPTMGARSAQRVELPHRGLAEELRAVLDAFSSSNPTTALPATGLAEGAVDTLPFRAVREALVNAVMHRDWSLSRPIVIDHAEAELMVHSPGPFLDGITEKTVLTTPSRTRNPLLGGVLRSLRIAEREGTGVDRMFIEMVRLGHRPPTFNERDGGVRVTLRGGPPLPQVLQVHATLPERLRQSARAAVAIDILRHKPSFSAPELADAAQESADELAGFLEGATAAGLLQRTANTRRGGIPAWRLTDQQRELLGSVLPYYARPAEESVRLIGQLAQVQGEVRNQDVQDLLGLTSARASQLLKRAEGDNAIQLGPGAKPTGRGTFYVPAER
ncbi:MAG: putative DNA binding domain-containing protein [Solirubrobacterales bacterium]|nr:putative DNA binding domain-containing protein [Solirubrobacterales bacterium]